MIYYNTLQYIEERGYIMKPSQSIAFQDYKDTMRRNIKYLFPQLSSDELERAIEYSIDKRIINSACQLNDTYKNAVYNTNMLELTEYIMHDRPILTSFGCLFHRHGDVDNPLYTMIQEFADRRNRFKKEMLKHKKGSEQYKAYDLKQAVAKIDVNGIYGAMGQPSSIFYNFEVAASITRQGRASITASIMLFESFLANNIKFGSLNEVIMFIDHIVLMKPIRQYEDHRILDRDISIQEVFDKLMSSCGYRWKPDHTEANMIWKILHQLSQFHLNRLYYKNNIYAFFNNTEPKDFLLELLYSLDSPFIDPNSPPPTIKDKLDVLVNMVKEYIYYPYQIIDKIERVETLYRQIDLVTDTDSCIICLNPWYEYVANLTKDLDIDLKHYELDMIGLLNKENPNDASDLMEESKTEYIYDFRNKEILERKRLVDPFKIIPEDAMRYSIINILAYIISKLLRDYFDRISIKNNVTNDTHNFCLMNMKNEFLFLRMLLSDAKKHYASIVELQEGHKVPLDKQLDIKGLQIDKSVVPESTKEALGNILHEDVLRPKYIDQMKIINKLAVLEKTIYDDIYNGGLKYYSPKKLKPFVTYKNPMSTQQVKASIVYNLFRNEDEAYINIDENNSVLIIGVNIDAHTLESCKLKESNPEKYEIMRKIIYENPVIEVSQNKIAVKIFNDNLALNSRKITSIAIPRDSQTPKWILEFIDYASIVKDNIGTFPLKSIGITKLDTNSAYSGIINL